MYLTINNNNKKIQCLTQRKLTKSLEQNQRIHHEEKNYKNGIMSIYALLFQNKFELCTQIIRFRLNFNSLIESFSIKLYIVLIFAIIIILFSGQICMKMGKYHN